MIGIARRSRVPGIFAPAALPAALVLALASGGCGGSSSAPASSAPTGSAAAQRAYVAARARGAVSGGPVTQRPQRGTGGSEANDENPSSASGGRGATAAQNPCALVTRSQAQTILGAPIAPPQQAPLGPTCIYRRLGGADYVTLAIETSDFAKLTPHLGNRRRMAVAGHTAYCGNYGRQTTFVALSGGRVLSIAAPCSVGERFAAKALARLKT